MVGVAPAMFTVSCPTGTLAATAATVAQAGTYVLDVNLYDGLVGITGGDVTNGSMTYSGMPAVTSASSAASRAGRLMGRCIAPGPRRSAPRVLLRTATRARARLPA